MRYSRSPKVRRTAVPLEGDQELAALVGCIISQFALTEMEVPGLLGKLTGMRGDDAHAIVGVFRAFSNRIDLLAEVIKRRAEGSPERIIYGYFKGRLKEANAIRNKYAHATYAGGKDQMVLIPYSGDHNRAPEFIEISPGSVKADLLKIATINYELTMWRTDQVPQALWKQLPSEFRA